MSNTHTRFVWDGEHGLQEYALPCNTPVIPAQGTVVTTRFPIDGRFEKITGRVTEVAVDYTQNEIVLHLTDVEVLA